MLLDRGISYVVGPELRVLDTFGCRSRLGLSCLLPRIVVGCFVCCLEEECTCFVTSRVTDSCAL